jgi:hypothetical protein
MSGSSGLRQRRQPKSLSATASRGKQDPSTSDLSTATKANQKRSRRDHALFAAIVVFYIPFIVVINPLTFPRIWARYYPSPCQGICQVDNTNPALGPIDTTRLVFLRIPKTASTTLIELFANQTKATKAVDLGELEDVVSSIPYLGAKKSDRGFHNPETRSKRMRDFYRGAARSILFPKFGTKKRIFFEGHMHYFNFTQFAPIYYPNSTKMRLLPDWLLDLYSYQYPKAPLIIPQFTFLRQPQERLASMYHYDRTATRNQAWRDVFVQRYGNQTINECLENATCVQQNDLQRWCNLQTELLCGVECPRGDSEDALQQAKQVMSQLLMVGLTERLDDSLKLLTRLVPTYLENIPERVPRSKVTTDKEPLSEASKLVLKDMCRYDQALYDHAEDLLSLRLGVLERI